MAASVPTSASSATSQLLDTVLPGGASWSAVCARATALTLVDLEGEANVAALLYRACEPLERYCMPDTLKTQHLGRLTEGVALYSDMGRVLASITADTCGWHDTITGHLTDRILAQRWGALSYQEAGNEWRRSARDALLVELAKWGLGPRDLVANISFFSKVAVSSDGGLEFIGGRSPPGTRVTVRFELDTLVVLASVPHPLDPSPRWRPRPIRLLLERVDATPEDDPVRTACPENERGFAATEAALP
jgi:uncharacterized protein